MASNMLHYRNSLQRSLFLAVALALTNALMAQYLTGCSRVLNASFGPKRITALPNGACLLAGSNSSINSGIGYLARVNESGEIPFCVGYGIGFTTPGYTEDWEATPDGGYIGVGKGSASDCMHAIKLDSAGFYDWEWTSCTGGKTFRSVVPRLMATTWQWRASTPKNSPL